MGDRRIDGICVTSKSHSAPEKISLSETRRKREEGWLKGEDVVIVEHGTGDYSWKKYGELDVRRRMFERDWPNANVEKYILLMESATKSANKDTAWMFEHELDDFEFIVNTDNDYFRYSTFAEKFD